MKDLISFIFICLIDFSKAKALMTARMSEFNNKFNEGRDNCDAKDFTAFCTR